MSRQDLNFDLNKSTYDWCVKSFHVLQKRLGVNLKIHHEQGLIKQGDIFLFNHFARFETVVPPYLIHQATGAYCRSVADHALFEGNERMASFLRSVGAVPNDMPGLLPFLASEILKGNKIVIFPEGGMVKDRRVLDENGDYNVYSRTAEVRRKHHKGASVLALTLETFKRRILTLQQRNDTVRIDRWAKALDMPSREALLKAATKPTIVVPGTITFYPLRIDENAFSRSAEFWSKDFSPQFIEELVIEGNILTKDTDMDIRLGAPLLPQKKWQWWERVLLERYFKKVYSLEDLFNLREHHAEDWTERMLIRCISQKTKRIRDLSMKALYMGITVNLSHVASYLIFCAIKDGRKSINLKTFHTILYLALKKLQNDDSVFLHRSLGVADRYRGVIDGRCPALERFLRTAKSAGLINISSESYEFLEPLFETFGFDDVRLNNPLLIYANEVAPIDAVRHAIRKAMEEEKNMPEQQLAALLFDDETRSHDWNRKHFQKPKYAAINDQETVTEDGAPYLLLPKKKTKVGVLLIHGLLASPSEWQDYAKKLHQQGLAVMGVRLAGHGTSPWDLHQRTWQDWLASVERSRRILLAHCEEIVVIGFSSGGILALIHAAMWPENLAAVASINAPIKFQDPKMAFVPLIQGINKIADWLPLVNSILPFQEHESEHPHINYHNMPIAALHQLQMMIDDLQRRLPAVQAPVLLVQGDEDPVVHPDSVNHIYGKLATDCQLKWVKSDRHGIVTDDRYGTWEILDTFLTGITSCPCSSSDIEKERA